MTNTANLKRFSDRTEQILSTIKSGNRMSLGTSGDLKTQLEAITDKYSSVLVEAPQDPVKGDKWFDGKSTWTYDTDAQAWLPDFVTPNKSYFSFAATVTANTATDLTQAIEIQDNDFYKVTIDFVSATGAWQVFFTVKEDNGAKIWNGTSWVGQDAEVDYHSFSGDTDSVAHLVFRPISKSSESDRSKFKLVITSTTSSDYRGTAVIDHLATGALTNGAVYDTTTGGGSTFGALPKDVIVIDPDAAEVEGKVYNNFRSAKDYMMEHYLEKAFTVELPAGNFDERITLSEYWEIHGNKTQLIAPVDTAIKETGTGSSMYEENRCLQNCLIAGGFVVDNGAQGIKCYHIYDCTVLTMSEDAGNTPTTAALFAYNSFIDTSDESSTSTVWYAGQCVGCMIKNLNVNIGGVGFAFFSCEIAGINTHTGDVMYMNCTFMNAITDLIVTASGSSPLFNNCYLSEPILNMADCRFYNSHIFHPNITGVRRIYLHDSSCEVAVISQNTTVEKVGLERSHFQYEDTESQSATLTISSLECDAISLLRSTNKEYLVTPVRSMNIIYSTGQGSPALATLSNTATNAGHYGICKDLSRRIVEVDNYMWFPMPS